MANQQNQPGQQDQQFQNQQPGKMPPTGQRAEGDRDMGRDVETGETEGNVSDAGKQNQAGEQSQQQQRRQ